jgi:hypothetical protein
MECDVFRDEMLEVLYGEAEPEAARRFQEHQAQCAACRDEILAFRRVRRELGTWKLPADLRPDAPVRRVVATWGRASWLAAAAGLLLAVGGALGFSGSELRYEQGRLSFRLGRGASDAEFRALLEQQEERHQRELAALRSSLPPASAMVASHGEVMDQVQRLIEDSEARQALLVSTSLSRLRHETEAQRQYDLAQVGAGLSYLEGQTGLQMARQTQLMGHVLQAAQKK